MNTSKKEAAAAILVIDDEPTLRRIFSYTLEDRNYEVLTAENGRIGIETFEREKPDLVLTDLRMPEADGLEVLKHIRGSAPETPVIVISGANSLDDAVQALRLGAWDYLIKPLHDIALLGHAVDKALERARLQKENRLYREHLEALVEERTEQLEKRNRLLEISRRQIIGILSQAAEYRDFETGNHFLRVSELAGCIARGLGWDENRVHNIQLAAPVHDIGKIGIPDNILLKNGKLTDQEWKVMKDHCLYGKQILTTNKFVESFCHLDHLHLKEIQDGTGYSIIETAGNIALNHHEHWDGSGYPLGLRGEEIPVEARITAIADVYDALRSARPYKEPWSEEKSRTYILEKSGFQFDPEIVNVFMNSFDEIRLIRETFKD